MTVAVSSSLRIFNILSKGVNMLLLQYWFSIAVDSNPVGADRTYRALYWMKNPAPGIFRNVAVYAGDPWHTAVQGIIKDIKYATDQKF